MHCPSAVDLEICNTDPCNGEDQHLRGRVKDMSDALYKSQQEFKQAKVEAEVLLVKEQKAMADTSPEGLAEASEYAAKEQKVVQKMEQESMEQTQLVSACRNQPTTWPLCNSSFCFVPFLQGSAKKRDLKVERWLRIHRERGAVPFDQQRRDLVLFCEFVSF